VGPLVDLSTAGSQSYLSLQPAAAVLPRNRPIYPSKKVSASPGPKVADRLTFATLPELVIVRMPLHAVPMRAGRAIWAGGYTRIYGPSLAGFFRPVKEVAALPPQLGRAWEDCATLWPLLVGIQDPRAGSVASRQDGKSVSTAPPSQSQIEAPPPGERRQRIRTAS
jgi:hypothetical protein